MKILIVSDFSYPNIGGIESYIFNIAKILVKRGFEVFWLSSKLIEQKQRDEIEGIKIERIKIPFERDAFSKGRFFFPLASFKKLISISKKFDILHVNTFMPSITSWIISKINKIPSLLFCHEVFGNIWKEIGKNFIEKNFFKTIEKLILKSPYKKICCPSLYTKKKIKEISGKDAEVIYHGIDKKIFNPKAKPIFKESLNLNEKVVGYIGRLALSKVIGSKDLMTLLKAFSYVSKKDNEVNFLFGGIGFDELIPYIRKLKIKNVYYIGKIPQATLPNFYTSCNLIAGSSISEGFGFLYAEASACGRPVVATKGGSIPEIILNGRTGILVNIKDYKSLANSILKLLEDEKLAKRFGKNGYKYMKKFEWKKSVKKHLEIYKELSSKV